MQHGLKRLPPPDMSLVLAHRVDDEIALDEDDFDEVLEVDVELDDLGETNQLAHAGSRESGTYQRELVAPPDPASARYVVSAGERPGEITLRPLEGDEPPPFGVPIAKLEPSSALDAWSIGALLDR